MTRVILTFAMTLSAVILSAFAALACESVPDRSNLLDPLIERLSDAEDQTAALLITNELWAVWADAPDDHAQELLDTGIKRRAGMDLEGALAAFDALIDYCPDYAEGYNQRAFVQVINMDYALALHDLEQAVARDPRHIAALTGLALTLIKLGRDAERQQTLRRAVDLNPWLPERRYLSDPTTQEL